MKYLWILMFSAWPNIQISKWPNVQSTKCTSILKNRHKNPFTFDAKRLSCISRGALEVEFLRKLKCGFIHFVIFPRSLYDNKIAVIENGTFEGLAGLQTLWVNIHLKRIYFHFSKVLNVSKIMDGSCFLFFQFSFIYNGWSF